MSRSVVLPIAVTATTILGLGFAAAFVDPSAVVFFGAYAGIGAYLVVRRPSNPIGWLLMLTGWGLVIGNAGHPQRRVPGRARGRRGPARPRAGRTVGWILVMTGIFGLALVFPGGHLPEGRGRRWSQSRSCGGRRGGRPGHRLRRQMSPSDDRFKLRRPCRRPSPSRDTPGEAQTPDPGICSRVCSTLAGVVALIRRYRRATGLERLQYRWLVAASCSSRSRRSPGRSRPRRSAGTRTDSPAPDRDLLPRFRSPSPSRPATGSTSSWIISRTTPTLRSVASRRRSPPASSRRRSRPSPKARRSRWRVDAAHARVPARSRERAPDRRPAVRPGALRRRPDRPRLLRRKLRHETASRP